MTLTCPVPAGTFNTWTFFLAWTVMLWVSGAPVNAREPNLNISALFSSPSSPTRHLRNPLPLCPVEGEAPLSNVHTVLLYLESPRMRQLQTWTRAGAWCRPLKHLEIQCLCPDRPDWNSALRKALNRSKYSLLSMWVVPDSWVILCVINHGKMTSHLYGQWISVQAQMTGIFSHAMSKRMFESRTGCGLILCPEGALPGFLVCI